MSKRLRAMSAAEVSPAASLGHLADAIASGKGGMFELVVMHDDDCPKINGGGECRCNPEMRVGRPTRGGRN